MKNLLIILPLSFLSSLVFAKSGTIAQISANGSGCPSNAKIYNPSGDAEDLRIKFIDLKAELSKRLSARDSRRNCQITIDYDVEDDYQYALAGYKLKGSYDLDWQSRGEVQVSYYFKAQLGPQNI